ncbi:MAG: PAS domain S-box protein [Proteobacteria bacterium]|nr:PAS domain S-box protein [Pseudomonadota bacterium]
MKDEDKAKGQLIKELLEMRQRIAELEASEIERRHTEELYQTLAEKSWAAVYVVQNGVFQFINPNVAFYTGHTSEELTGRTSISIVHPEDREMARKYSLEMLREERTSPYKFRIVTKDGGIQWIMETVTSIYYKGKPAVLGNSMDITERIMAEDTLRESEQRLADIIDFLPDATFAIDLEGRIVAWNRAMEEMTGVRAKDMLGKGNYEYAIPFYGTRRPVLIDLVFKSDEEIEKKYSFIRKEKDCLIVETDVPFVRGRNLHLWGKASPIYDHKGNVVGAIESIRDVTERKRIKDALKQSEEKYRTLVESTLDIIFTVDRKGEFTYINPKFEEVTCYPASDLAGCPFTHIVAPEYVKPTVGYFKHGMGGQPVPSYEIDLIRKNGERIPVEFLVTTLLDTSGQAAGRFGIGRDITERKRAEAEKKKLEAKLQQAQKMESIGTLAGGIAHDFNNLLTGIQGNASLALLNIDPGHTHYEKIKNIEQYVQTGAKLTKQLLGFARGGKYEVKPTDLNDLLKKSSEMFGRTMKEIKIHTNYQKDVWTVEVDQGQTEQVLLNLYVNAGHAMPRGGELYLETENVTLDENYVKPSSAKPGEYVKISVTDTGVGMDEATKRKIFDPFFTTKEMDRGTGLGLASAYGIIKNHGGIINVYSERGVGTTFNIYLPASTAGIRDRGSGTGEGQILRGHETVLFVDDEEMITDVGTEMLKTLGYEVLIAGSGRKAIEVYGKNRDRIDIVILDMIMPEMGGGKTYDLLKGINPDIKVLLSSGYSINGQATEILERGCDGFIQKPFDLKNLSQKIRKILDKK